MDFMDVYRGSSCMNMHIRCYITLAAMFSFHTVRILGGNAVFLTK